MRKIKLEILSLSYSQTHSSSFTLVLIEPKKNNGGLFTGQRSRENENLTTVETHKKTENRMRKIEQTMMNDGTGMALFGGHYGIQHKN